MVTLPPLHQQSSEQALGVQILTLPVALTMICLQEPSALRKRTRLAPAVPRGENNMTPAFVMLVPGASGFVSNGLESRSIVYSLAP
jgi:hypothetical protein